MLIRPGGVGRFGGRRAAARSLKDDMPAGALGIWSARDYVASPRRYVPNLVQPTAPAPRNLLSSPRGQFANTQRYTASSCTVTAGQTDEDGGTRAALLAGTGNWTFNAIGTITLPAGTYTLVSTVKRGVGTDQPFSSGGSGAGATVGSQLATASWARCPHTFTTTGGAVTIFPARSIDGSTAATILIDKVELYIGNADAGYLEPSTHLLIGRNAYDSFASHDGATFGPGTVGEVNLPNSTSFSAFTVICVGSRTVTGRTHHNIMSRLGTGTGNFSTSFGENNVIPSPAGGGAFPAQPIYRPYQDGWHMWTHVGDSTNSECWLDNVSFLRTTAGITNFTMADITFGMTSTISFLNDYRVAIWALYDRRLSEAEILSAYATLQNYLLANGTTLPTNPLQIGVADGDSVTQQANNYLVQSSALVSSMRYLANYAVAGSQLSDVVSRKARPDATLRTAANAGQRVVYSLYIGINGLSSYAGANSTAGATNFANAVLSYIDEKKAFGASVRALLATVGPIGGATGTEHNVRRAIANPLLEAALGTRVDAIADFGGNATMGPDGAPPSSGSSANWLDEKHPSSDGSLILASQEWVPAVDSLAA